MVNLTTFQGNPCKIGHSGLRYISNGSCVLCQQLRNESKRRDIQHRRRVAAHGADFQSVDVPTSIAPTVRTAIADFSRALGASNGSRAVFVAATIDTDHADAVLAHLRQAALQPAVLHAALQPAGDPLAQNPAEPPPLPPEPWPPGATRETLAWLRDADHGICWGPAHKRPDRYAPAALLQPLDPPWSSWWSFTYALRADVIDQIRRTYTFRARTVCKGWTHEAICELLASQECGAGVEPDDLRAAVAMIAAD